MARERLAEAPEPASADGTLRPGQLVASLLFPAQSVSPVDADRWSQLGLRGGGDLTVSVFVDPHEVSRLLERAETRLGALDEKPDAMERLHRDLPPLRVRLRATLPVTDGRRLLSRLVAIGYVLAGASWESPPAGQKPLPKTLASLGPLKPDLVVTSERLFVAACWNARPTPGHALCEAVLQLSFSGQDGPPVAEAARIWSRATPHLQDRYLKPLQASGQLAIAAFPEPLTGAMDVAMLMRVIAQLTEASPPDRRERARALVDKLRVHRLLHQDSMKAIDAAYWRIDRDERGLRGEAEYLITGGLAAPLAPVGQRVAGENLLETKDLERRFLEPLATELDRLRPARGVYRSPPEALLETFARGEELSPILAVAGLWPDLLRIPAIRERARSTIDSLRAQGFTHIGFRITSTGILLDIRQRPGALKAFLPPGAAPPGSSRPIGP